MDPNAPSIPHSREAEEALIGSVLINPECYYEDCISVQADDFYIHRNRWIWEAFIRMHAGRKEIDILTVSEELDQAGQLEEIGGPAYLTSLINQVPSSLHAAQYAEIVLTNSVRRQAITCANTIATAAYADGKTVDEISSTVMEEAVKIAVRPGNNKRLISAQQAADNEYNRLIQVSSSHVLPGIPTGFIDVDSLLQNMRPGELEIIAGRPGMGKTSFMQTIVRKQCEEGKHILIAQVADMDTGGWMERMISMQSEIPLEHIRSGRIPEVQVPFYTHAFEEIRSWNFMIDDSPRMTPERLQGVCRRAQAQMRGLDLIIVDYLQKMGVPSRLMHTDNRVREVGYVAGALKDMARDLEIPVLAAAQLNRSLEARGDKRPMLSDLRESGEIENDADSVMFIYRDEVYNADTIKKNIAEIIIAKNRNGPVGTVELTWRPNLTRFDNMAKY